MKQRILQVITSLLLIMTLTMANFLLLCVNVVSYAAEVINVEKSTNHKNIEFMAYFKDQDGNKNTSLDASINNDNLKLYFQVSVKQEGYFNGNIILNNANFKFKTDIISGGVSKIEDNTIYLNQINAGETIELEVGIELLKNEQFDLDLIDIESKISIEGIYRDSTQKDISIKAIREIDLNMVNPYTDGQGINLSQEVITNKVLSYNGENKRIVQVLVKSGLNGNLFPVKTALINIKVPKISDKYPENVLVNSNDTLVTNGKMLSQDDWDYNAETGLININLENKEENNKVSWIQNGEDRIIITYVFDKDVEINDEKISVNSKIQLYDTNSTIIEKSSEVLINKDEKDAIATTRIEQNEENIYKGKLYAGISRNITYKNIINVNLNNVASEINISEDRQKINGEVLKATYNTTKINKANVENALGENGSLNIIDTETGNIIATINKHTQTDENGYIVVSYPESVETITIKILSPENIGKIEIETTKTINSIDRNIVKKASNISLNTSVSYISNNNETRLETTESNIELKETETSASLQMDRTELSVMTTNNNIEFRVILNSKQEKDELFKNPVLRLELPEKIQNIQVNSIDLIYEDELKIRSAVLKDRVIEIALEGEQTKYKDEAIDGAIIIINANLTTSPQIPSSTEQVKLTYTNENAINYKDGASIGTAINDINIVSYVGVVTTNQISEYGIDIVNNEGTKLAELPISADTKNVTIEKKIINNKENKISNVRILGVFPTKEAIDTNSIDVEVGNLVVTGIDDNRVKVYYSNNENATDDIENQDNNWSESIENSKNVKKYLVMIDELDLLEEVDLSYQITIPSNLEYNESAEEGYTVYYTNVTTEEKINVNNIRLATPRGAMLETTLKGLVAGKEVEEIKENETLRYEIIVSNTGSEDISNVKIVAKVPEEAIYVNTDALNNEIDLDDLVFEDENKKDIKFNIDTLAKGETITKYYEVKVKEGMSGKELSNAVTTQYGEVSKTSNEVKTKILNGNLELKLVSVDAKDGIVKNGYSYRYVLYVTNKEDKDVKNVNTIINTNDMANIKEIYYMDENGQVVTVKDTDNITIEKIKAGETVKVAFYASIPVSSDNVSKQVTISAKSVVGNIEQNSNEINHVAKSNLLLSMKVTSENSGNYVKSGDTIKYNIVVKNDGTEAANAITLNNWISNDVTLTKVTKNGIELSNEDYLLEIDSNKNKKLLKLKEESLNAGNSIEYQIEVVVNLLYGNTKAIEIINETLLQVSNSEVATSKVEHILQPDETFSNVDNDDSDNNDNNNNNNSGNNNNNNNNDNNEGSSASGEKYQYRIISGIAWIDENENGQREAEEETLEGVTVKLLDVTTNKFVKDSNGNELSVKTAPTGFYSFNKVRKGQYLVIFEYDTTQYGLTTFEKDGVSNEMNSNVINKNISIEETNKKVAATEILNVDKDNLANVNIGLIVAKKYDLQLDKYISKVTVQNSKTVTKTYTDMTLVKEEIDAKQVNSTTVVVEYTIKVTNKGDVTAYVKKIADYLSSDYKFSSELNKEWYQSGNNVYCTSLSNEKIEPGESKEVTLIVIKEMKENNTGLINNTAEILDSYNEYGLTDINSTEGNKTKGENDMGSADLIISIRTGQVVMTVFLIISTIVILGIAVFLIRKIIINKRFI